MEYKLNDNGNGEVTFITTAGSDFVKSTMPVGKAKGIIASGKVKESDKFEGFGIKVNDKYYFAGSIVSEEEKPKQDSSKE